MKVLKRLIVGLLLATACSLPSPAVSWADSPEATYKAAFTADQQVGSSESPAEISEDETSIVMDSSDFGFSSFERMNKGTNRAYSGTYYGYRYQMASSDAFAVVNAHGYSLVYIPESRARALGVSLSDEAFQETFISMLKIIDSASSNGGTRLEALDNQVFFTSEQQVEMGGYTYSFGVEVEEGVYYATITQGDSTDCSAGGIYAESGLILPASEISVAGALTGLAWVVRFLQNLDWSPLWVSLRTTGAAIVIIFLLGLLAAWLTVKASSRLKGILDTVFTIPMVLPPTVCGFLLLMFFGGSSPTGQWLIEHGIDIVFTWPATVIACSVVGFPMMYRTVRGAFENLDANMLDAARTLGWSEPRIFARIMVPLAWPSIAAGTVLGFARAMGEFGCTLFFAGNYVGVTQTIPLAIYYDWMGGNTDAAIFWVIVVILISFLVILFINVYSSRTQTYLIRPGKKGKTGKKRAHGSGSSIEVGCTSADCGSSVREAGGRGVREAGGRGVREAGGSGGRGGHEAGGCEAGVREAGVREAGGCGGRVNAADDYGVAADDYGVAAEGYGAAAEGYGADGGNAAVSSAKGIAKASMRGGAL